MIDPDAVAPEAVPGVRVLPVVHDRVEMAAAARAALDRLDPAAVAVELPAALAPAAQRAVARLPRISILLSEEPGEDALVWAVAPGDPFAEALRWAAERGRPSFFVDPDLPAYERAADPVPDPYALVRLGAEGYLAALAEAAARRPAGELDRRREAGMAFHVREALGRLAAEPASDRADGPPAAGAASDPHPATKLLILVGAAHARRLAARLAEPAAQPLVRRRKAEVSLRHLHPRSLTALLPDPPLAHAVWELLRSARGADPGGEGGGSVGTGLPPEPPLAATAGRRLSLVRAGLRLVTPEPEPWGAERRRRLVEYAAHRGVAPGPGGRPVPDRWRLGRVVWAVGSRSYAEQTAETTQGWQRRTFFDFAYRHARCQGLLAPGLYEWVVAGRGVGDDNLAWELFEAARAYPWQEELAEIATAEIDGDELDLGTRKVRFRRRFFRVKQRLRAVPVRERRQPADPESWLAGFAGGGLCSYPPEDLVVEDYGRFLRAKAAALLSAERSRSEPFSGSLLDGVDVRETLAHLLDPAGPAAGGAGKIWVREMGRAPGRAGSVVAIFDRDREGDRFPYLMTWLGEHDQESDMAFYSTHPAEQVVGPGIMRATYGGFLMTVPPGRLADVWQDPDYADAREKADVLVMAAVDYSEEKLVVHLAARPPAEHLRRYAAAQKKRLVHVPLGSVSPAAAKKLRVLHILAGRDKRAIAKDYVW